MLQVGSHWSRSTYQRVLVGSRAINTPHYLTTVPLARVAGGGHFYAVCEALAAAVRARFGAPSRGAWGGNERSYAPSGTKAYRYT